MRDAVLDKAREAINGPREDNYGSPYENHKRIADIWSAMTGYEFTPSMVSAMMIGIKLSRAREDNSLLDNWVDIAGYSAITWEVLNEELKREAKKKVDEVSESFRKAQARKGDEALYEHYQYRNRTKEGKG